MKIVVTQIKRHKFIADCMDLPGMPPIGEGRTRSEAMGNFLIGVLSCPDKKHWLRLMGLKELVMINVDKKGKRTIYD